MNLIEINKIEKEIQFIRGVPVWLDGKVNTLQRKSVREEENLMKIKGNNQ